LGRFGEGFELAFSGGGQMNRVNQSGRLRDQVPS
jgi:hypothetical protein